MNDEQLAYIEELTNLCKKQEDYINSLEEDNKILSTMIEIIIETWKISNQGLIKKLKKIKENEQTKFNYPTKQELKNEK